MMVISAVAATRPNESTETAIAGSHAQRGAHRVIAADEYRTKAE
jgi:hypothetical protein